MEKRSSEGEADRFGEQVEAVEETAVGGLSARQGVAAFARDGDEALGPTSALGSGTAITESDKALVFHAVQRRIKRARGDIAASASGDLGQDSHTVSVLAQAQCGQKNNLFELTERGLAIHMNYNVVFATKNCLVGSLS